MSISTGNEGPASLPLRYPAPLFTATAAEVDFGTIRKPSSPRRASFRVGNAGGEGTLRVELGLTAAGDWLRVHPLKLSLAPGEEQSVTVEVDPGAADCPAGQPAGVGITVSAPDSSIPAPEQIRVQVRFEEQQTLSAQPATVQFPETAVGESTHCVVSVERSDGGEFILDPDSVTVMDSEGKERPAWMHVEMPRARARRHEVTLVFHTANWRPTPEPCTCTVRIGEEDEDTRPVAITVPLQVLEAPRLEWKTSALLTAYPGDIQRLSLTLANTGEGELRGRIATEQRWLSPATREFSLEPDDSETIEVQVGGELAPGLHEGSLDIRGNDGGRERLIRIPVKLTVEPLTACAIRADWVGDLGETARGRRAAGELGLTNRMAREFSGRLVAMEESPWLRFEPEQIRLGPGQGTSVRVVADTRRLTAGRPPVENRAAFGVDAGEGNICWADEAVVRVRKAPSAGRWVMTVLCLGLLGFGVPRFLNGDGAVPPESPTLNLAPSTQGEGGASPRKDGVTARALYDKGWTAYNNGRWTEAVALFTRAAEVDPEAAGCYLALGCAYYQAQDYAKAEEALRQALELKPSSTQAQEWLKKVQAKLQATGQ